MSDIAITAAPGAAARLAAWSIRQYQRRISPYKGFVCAHRVLHRGESCSQYVLRIVQQQGVRRALTAARGRFQDCRAAAHRLANRSFEERLHDDAVEKRRRLAGTSGQASPCVERMGCLGDVLMIGACAELTGFGCCGDW
jgi:putative component of membrane protein insertase Oxa1/YidC/SpoIIIJ protein YidD